MAANRMDVCTPPSESEHFGDQAHPGRLPPPAAAKPRLDAGKLSRPRRLQRVASGANLGRRLAAPSLPCAWPRVPCRPSHAETSRSPRVNRVVRKVHGPRLDVRGSSPRQPVGSTSRPARRTPMTCGAHRATDRVTRFRRGPNHPSTSGRGHDSDLPCLHDHSSRLAVAGANDDRIPRRVGIDSNGGTTRFGVQ